jgi:hypothetical protein
MMTRRYIQRHMPVTTNIRSHSPTHAKIPILATLITLSASLPLAGAIPSAPSRNFAGNTNSSG